MASLCAADDGVRYFYTGQKDGSESLFNPVNLILNGSYDIIQLDGQSRNLLDYPYSYASGQVFQNLRDPFTPISHYGWGNFFKNEILPFGFNERNSQGWPNYNLHLIGGGMTYRALCEWYNEYGFPAPVAFSLATVAAYHVMNEVVENGYFTGDNVDPIADIYIFDIGGIILFSFDNVNRFFSRTLNLADWSLQPSISVLNGTLRNNGQYFSIKWKFPNSAHWHLFYYFGLDGVLGTSYKWDDGSALSGGFGLRSVRRETVNAATNQQTVALTWNLGFFYDHDNSLLASLFFNGTFKDAVTLNVYPGVFSVAEFSPGVWLALERDGSPSFGLTTRWTPGIAF